MRRPGQRLAGILKNHRLTIAFAESMTCGLVVSQLGNIPGASTMLAGGIICYDERIKSGLFKISAARLEKFSAESKEITDDLALNLGKLINADIHAAVTGLASEGGSESKTKPVGTVFYSFLFKKKLYREKKRFAGSPLQIKKQASNYFFQFIYDSLFDHFPSQPQP